MGALLQQSSVAIAVLAGWVLFGLVGHDPWKPDEAYTFGLVFHILESGDWVVPTLGGQPFVEKPPLFFITAAIFAKLFGGLLPLHDAARLASGFYAGLTLWFTYLAAGRKIAAPLLLAGCLGYVVHSHQLITDNALMAGIAIGLYGLSVTNGVLLGTGAGIAFLSKGLLGPGVLGLAALALLAFPQWRSRRYAMQLVWALVALAPWTLIWPALLHQRSPALFHEWFWVNNFGRFSGSAGLGGVNDHLLYLKALPWFALPALPLAAWTVWRAPRVSLAQPPLVLFLVTLLVLSASSSARTLYGLPLLVPLAVLAAQSVDSLPRWLSRPVAGIGTLSAAVGAAILWLAWIGMLLGWPSWLAARLEAASPGYVARIGAIALLLAIAVTAAWFLITVRLRRAEVAWTTGVTLVWALAMTLWLPFLDHAKSYRSVAEAVREHAAPGACVAGRGLTEPQRAVFHYFNGIVAGRECPLLLVHTSAAAEPPHGPEWKLAWRGTRPGDRKEFFWLFAR